MFFGPKRLGALALILATTPVSAASIADFTDSSLGISGSASFDVTLTGGDAAGTVVSFSNPVFDCLAGCASPDSFPTPVFTNLDGFTNASGINIGLYDVSFSQAVTLTAASSLDSGLLPNFLGLEITGGGLSETDVFAGLAGNSSATLGTGISFVSGQTYSFNTINTVFNGTNGGINFANWTFEAAPVSAVPLPAALPLLLAGLGGLGIASRRRKS